MQNTQERNIAYDLGDSNDYHEKKNLKNYKQVFCNRWNYSKKLEEQKHNQLRQL